MRIETDGQKRAARAKHTTGLVEEGIGIAEMVQRIDAEQAVEARRWPWQLVCAGSREHRKRRGHSRSLEHLQREIDSSMPARPIPHRGQPVPGAASHLSDVSRSRRTLSANEALKCSQHGIVTTRLPALVV